MIWHPIATAPQDGTKVLLCRVSPGCEHHGRVRVDWWRSYMRDGYNGFGHFNPQYWPATHWAQLPELPDA